MGGRLRAGWLVGAALAAACGGASQTEPAPQTAPLPTAGVAGRKVTVYPLTLVVGDGPAAWADAARPREVALRRADSLLAAFLTERAPEVTWVLPDELRSAARRAPGMLANPDQMGTALLRGPALEVVPDPLRSQMRTLTGIAGDRFALVPAALVFVGAAGGGGRAELTLVMTDVRTGRVGWRTVARGEGEEPWAAFLEALSGLVPDLP